MSRLDKKCLLGAAGAHVLLIGVLIVGPAFVSSTPKSDDSQVLTILPDLTTDKMFSSGGSPTVVTPAPAPKPPEPKPEPILPKPVPTPPVPEVRPEPKPEPKPVVPKPEPEHVKPAPVDPIKSPEPDFVEHKPTHKLPDVSLTPVVRKPGKTIPKPADDEPDPRALALARAREFNNTARSLRNNLSGATAVETSSGPGGGGPSYANYGQVVKTIYTHAWIEPQSVTDEEATATAVIVIARDGTVISARLSKPSGNAEIDASVLRTLRRVTSVPHFPEGAKEEQRTYNINFNLKAKKSFG